MRSLSSPTIGGTLRTDPGVALNFTGRPGLVVQGSAERDRTREGLQRVREGREDPVTFVFHDGSVRAQDGPVGDPVVCAKDARPRVVAKRLRQAGGPLDITEQERHVATREGHVAILAPAACSDRP